MVTTSTDVTTSDQRFLIRPNRSMDWKSTVRIYLLILSVSVLIATGFALMGLWMIVPFTGMEMLLLAGAFYLCALRSRDYELIAVDENYISIEKEHGASGGRIRFQRHWARVDLEQPACRNQPSRLVVRSHGRSEEIGLCLNEEEKRHLARQLQRAIAFPS